MTERARVHLVERTITERFYYDPVAVNAELERRDPPWPNASHHDRILDLFEDVDGSQYGDRLFSSDANPSVGCELVERWDDE